MWFRDNAIYITTLHFIRLILKPIEIDRTWSLLKDKRSDNCDLTTFVNFVPYTLGTQIITLNILRDTGWVRNRTTDTQRKFETVTNQIVLRDQCIHNTVEATTDIFTALWRLELESWSENKIPCTLKISPYIDGIFACNKRKSYKIEQFGNNANTEY